MRRTRDVRARVEGDGVLLFDARRRSAHLLSWSTYGLWLSVDDGFDVVGYAASRCLPADAVRSALERLTELGLLYED